MYLHEIFTLGTRLGTFPYNDAYDPVGGQIIDMCFVISLEVIGISEVQDPCLF